MARRLKSHRGRAEGKSVRSLGNLRPLALALGVLVGSMVTPAAVAAHQPAHTHAVDVTPPGPVTPTDYADRSHWLQLPPGSSHRVDVFYLYPTSYTRTADGPVICTVDDPGMMKAAATAYSRQATAFRTFADIYAPYYRQVDADYQLAQTPEQQEQTIRGAPTVDVTAAFAYYLTHYNRGRPFILAAHSQGSAVLKVLLADYLRAHPKVQARMVAAYVVGQSVTPAYLAANPHLRFTRRPGDTGVLVSWNTEAPAIAAPNPVTLPGGIAVDPITWTTDQAWAGASSNPGSIQLDPSTGGTPVLNADGSIKRVRGLADARVDKARGVVVCSTVDAAAFPYYIPGGFPQGVLHTFDYPLYFFGVRANAAARTEAWLSAHR